MDDESPIIDLGEWPSFKHSAPEESAPRHVDRTRAKLAFCLVGVLAGSIALLLLLLVFRRVDADQFAQVASVVVSPLVGLVGAAVGYYYGKSDS